MRNVEERQAIAGLYGIGETTSNKLLGTSQSSPIKKQAEFSVEQKDQDRIDERPRPDDDDNTQPPGQSVIAAAAPSSLPEINRSPPVEPITDELLDFNPDERDDPKSDEN